MPLGLTQPLTEISTRNISWEVKAAGAWGWQPYHLHVPIVLKSGSLNLLEPSGPVQACNGILSAHHGQWKCTDYNKHCATNRKVAGSIPDGVIGIFHWHNPSGRTMALGLTQPLTEISTINISWEVKAAGAWGWQPYHLHVPIVLKSGILNLLEPSGPVQACNGIALPLPYTFLRNLCTAEKYCWILLHFRKRDSVVVGIY